MRICFVSAELAPINPDGIGTYVYLACRAFRDEGHEVHVLTVDSPDLQAHARGLFPGIRVHAARPGQGAAALEIHPNPHVLHAMAVHSTLNLKF